MFQQQANPVALFLPLLASPDPAVRRQAGLIMLGTYGDRALTYLRRLVDDADPRVREEARLALLAVAEITDSGVRLQSFRGMHVECLGRLRVYVGNHEMRDEDWAQAESGRAGAQKVRGALAYLVHCGRRGSTREALGAAVWGEAFSASSLSRTLTTLRQALKRHAGAGIAVDRALVIESDYCLLDPDAYHTDVQLFERAFGMAVRVEDEQGLDMAAPVYADAVQLYAGPYMADVLPGNGWSRQRRDHLMSSFVIAAERVAEHAYAQAQYARCIDVCALALDADPAADDMVVWLLRAYAQLELYAELEHAYRGYLRAAGLDAQSDEARQDAVVQAYQALVRTQV